MTTPLSSRPPEPLTVADAAWSLAELGWAPSYDEARADLEAARADVEAEAAVGARGAGEPISPGMVEVPSCKPR